jgi:hypothetical protein
MSGAMPPLSQYAFMAWCSVKAHEQLYLYLYLWGCTDDISGMLVSIVTQNILFTSTTQIRDKGLMLSGQCSSRCAMLDIAFDVCCV